MAMVAMHRQHQKGARPEACSGTDGGDTEAAAPNKSQRSTMAHRSSPHDGVTQKKNSLDVFVYNYLKETSIFRNESDVVPAAFRAGPKRQRK
jgi:hypothetical protein